MDTDGQTCCVYEKMALREAGDSLARPGGLELTQRAVCLAGICPGSRVLDMGCGTGVALQYLVEECEFCAVGIDVSKALLAEGGAKTPGLLLVRASGSALPFPDESMEAVLAECSLSLMDAEGALGECWRVLKREGLLLVHDVYARNPHAQLSLQGLPVKCCLTGAVSREQWVARLEARGFAVNLWEDHSHTLKEFAARLIFQHGSLNAFWGSSEIEDRLKIQCAVSSAKPGYFLAVAKKEA